MSFRWRAGMVGGLAILSLTGYGIARHYRHSLVVYVVEQSLIQKAPPDANPSLIRARLHAMLSSISDRNARFAKALSISQYVEKVQTLTAHELEQLLSVTPVKQERGSS